MTAALSTFTAAALGEQHFEPLRWAVPGLLPEGLCILAGRPKFGKSFAAMDLAAAVARGGKAFQSIDCGEPAEALYLALEDGPRRLQERLRRLVPFGDDLPSRLHIATEGARLRAGLETQVEDWLDAHPGARLVVIDTLARVRPEASGRSSAYDEDARSLSGLHEMSRRWPGLAVVIVHHVRKAESEDVFADISGTYGLSGIADTLLILGPHGNGAKLSGQGRDLEGYEKALQRDTFTGGWRLVGDARAMAKTGERESLLDVLHDAAGEALRTSTIAKAAGVSESSASHRLRALVDEGLVTRPRYGMWALTDPPSKSSKSSKLTEIRLAGGTDFDDSAPDFDDETGAGPRDFDKIDDFDGVRP